LDRSSVPKASSSYHIGNTNVVFLKEPHVLRVLCFPFYSMNMGLYHFSTCSTRPRILPFLREFNIVTLQQASWGLNSSDSSDLMLMPVRVFIFHISSIFGRYYCHLYPALSLFNPLSLGQYCCRIDFGMGKPTYRLNHLYHFLDISTRELRDSRRQNTPVDMLIVANQN
jgi:hypothetical protein